MLVLSFRLAAALQRYMAFYMPTNRAVIWLHSPRGLKWAVPVTLVATPTYLFAMSVCMTIIERDGPAYLHVLVMLFAWNALKFAALASTVLLKAIGLAARGWLASSFRAAQPRS